MGSLRCIVIRGLPKELEEQINKFLDAAPRRIHYLGQSESGNNVTVTLIYEDPPPEESDAVMGGGVFGSAPEPDRR
ncbi:MAG: hypothetical protein ACE5FG_07475 [Myxococcota bacterium]